MNKKYYIENLVNHDHILTNCSIDIHDDKVIEVKEEKCPKDNFCYSYAIPGFIDIHTHGGNGYELMDNNLEALCSMSEFYLKNGTTSFLTSTVTDFLPKIEKVLGTALLFMPINKKLAKEGKQAECIGVHLEGPWLSYKNLGAQNPKCCIVPEASSLNLIEKYQKIIKMVTFSYHTPESEKLLQFLVEREIIPACGHDEAIDEQIVLGFEKGIQVITHIYCVTSGFQRKGGLKHLGTLEMALMTNGVKVEVIADGKHITKYFWEFIKHNKSFDDILIISDSMRCAGLPEDPNKIYKLGDMDVIIDNGVAWLNDKSTFAGSVATMYTNFKRLIKEWGVEINDAVKICSYNQSKLLKCGNLGEIKPGKTADILLLDKELNIQKIIKSGIEFN